MNEMGLIEVPAVSRDGGPIYDRFAPNHLEDFLKAPHSAKQFGSESNLVTEHLDEPPGTEADLIGHVRDRANLWHPGEFAQSKGDSGMARKPGSLFEKSFFEDLKPGIGCLRL